MNRLGVVLFLLPLIHLDCTPVEAAWKTLSGSAPLVIANGGTSGLYPAQTVFAYEDALNYSLPGTLVTCDLQLVKTTSFPTGFCSPGDPGPSLSSTNANLIFPEMNRTYTIGGTNITGWFAVDFTVDEMFNLTAIQKEFSRTSIFDGLIPLFKPESLQQPFWLNFEDASFFEEQGLNATGYLIESMPVFADNLRVISATEVGILKSIKSAAAVSKTKLVFKFLPAISTEVTTGQTYGDLLKNLSDISTFASGILVPKEYIWPINETTRYLSTHTSLVDDAHKAKLEVYAYDFKNDQFKNSYNYSFDPVVEILDYIEKYNFTVDGLFSDFPTTASEAIACYASSSKNGSTRATSKPTVISHNGNSGDFPGCSLPAYTSAIAAGVDYIDCSVQITKDGALICRESPNLVMSTNVATTSFLETRSNSSYSELGDSGSTVYSFDLTLEEIQTQLKCVIYSPNEKAGDFRDQANDEVYPILTLAEFLSLAKNNSVGAFIDIQNAVFIRKERNLAVVDAVADALVAAGYTASDKVMVQSEDSSALARLRDLNVTYPLTYRIASPPSSVISFTASDFVDIKEYATSVSIQRSFIEKMDPMTGFLLPATESVKWAHAQNLSVFFFYLRNENTVFPWDLKTDPTLELYFLTENYKIDGFVTDFPLTTVNYFDNHCTANGSGSNNLGFTPPLVIPGELNTALFPGPIPPSSEPAPDLVVPEPPLLGVTRTPAPAPRPSAASHLSTCLALSTAFSILLNSLAVL